MTEIDRKDQNINEFNKFLENNKDFLQQKYQQYFIHPTIALKDINKQAGIKYISDIFNFSKYEQDEKMNQTLQKSLSKNIEDFVNDLAKKKVMFNSRRAVELLKYCIENNQMFAVKYDKKDKKNQTKQQVNQQNNEQVKAQQTQQQQKQENNQNEQNNLEESKVNETEKQQSVKNQSKIFETAQKMVNQFDQLLEQPVEKPIDPELIKKNMKQMFQFYCKQQQNVGANTTFDRISHECQTMTLGKFLSFATATQINNEKIDKNLLMRKFKLKAQGKKEIQFEHFYDILQTLSAIDETIIEKLGLIDKSYFKNKLKQRFIAFNTKGQNSRDFRREQTFVPKLTEHSGKSSEALKQQLELRRNARTRVSTSLQTKKLSSNPPTPSNQRYDMSNKSQIKDISQLLNSPAQLSNSNVKDFEEQMNFLQKVINAEDLEEEWIKQYKIPYKKANALLPPRLINRKQSLIPNLKKRVQELQKSETRQTAHLQKRQYLTTNNTNKGRQKVSRSILN